MVYSVSANAVTLMVKNVGRLPATVLVSNAYTGDITGKVLASGAIFEHAVSVAQQHGWYDLILTVKGDAAFRQEIAGHLETGKASITDPAIS